MKNYITIKKSQIDLLMKTNSWSFAIAIRYALSKKGWHYQSLDQLEIKELKMVYHVKGL